MFTPDLHVSRVEVIVGEGEIVVSVTYNSEFYVLTAVDSVVICMAADELAKSSEVELEIWGMGGDDV